MSRRSKSVKGAWHAQREGSKELREAQGRRSRAFYNLVTAESALREAKKGRNQEEIEARQREHDSAFKTWEERGKEVAKAKKNLGPPTVSLRTFVRTGGHPEGATWLRAKGAQS